MPFLRSVAGSEARALELRSSKTLVGSGAATCDVVVAGERVLELHALLNLAADKGSARLVPFSATSDGACYVNDTVVPRDGAVVVHGDRVAFGDPHNAFFFELTPPSRPEASLSPTHPRANAQENSMLRSNENFDSLASEDAAESCKTFRRALDALRGDRKPTTLRVSTAGSARVKRSVAAGSSASSATAASASGQKDQLSKFLLEASTDSLLSDYVERKLRQRRGSSKSQSNAFSTSSSLQNDKLHRRSVSRDASDIRQATDERNHAEVEKLRLSQRIREVDDVLNGDMDFQESYLSPTSRRRKNTRRSWMEAHLSAAHSKDRTSPEAFQSAVSDGGFDSSEKDDEDDLPSMMEKPTVFVQEPPGASVAVSIQTEASQESEYSRLPDENAEEATQTSRMMDRPPGSALETAGVQAQSQSDTQKQSLAQHRATSSAVQGISLAIPTFTSRRRTTSCSTKTERTGLHLKLIEQTIRRKRLELLSQVFVRWTRGLRVQVQRREHKTWLFDAATRRLSKLRRNQLFVRWRDFAATRGQALDCRLEAFQQRLEARAVRRSWVALYLHHVTAVSRLKYLRSLLVRRSKMARKVAFRMWQQLVQTKKSRDIMDKLQQQERSKIDAHLDRVARRHHRSGVQRQLLQVLARWRSVSTYQRKQRRALRKLLNHAAVQHKQRAWRKWTEQALLAGHHQKLSLQFDLRKQQMSRDLQAQHDQAAIQMQEEQGHQIQKLKDKIEEKNIELQQLKNERDIVGAKKAAMQTRWDQDLHGFFESAITRCDDHIAQANDRLELLLQQAESDLEAARFGASQFLVDTMLHQKLYNIEERVGLQEAQITALSEADLAGELRARCGDDHEENLSAKLNSSARFLFDMIQQRLARLQQLHQSMAKLAAVSRTNEGVLDPERLRHSKFVTEAIHQRQKTHIVEMMRIYCRLGLGTPPARAAQ